MHRSEFLVELKNALPLLVEDINDQGGLLHLEVSVFIEYTQLNIDNGSEKEVKKCFDLAHRFYTQGNQDIINAIGLSFAKDLNLEDSKKRTRSWAKSYLSKQLLSIYNDFNG